MRKFRPLRALPGAALALIAATAMRAAEPDVSLRQEVQHSIDQGLAWLKTQQKDEGWWSSADQPALTALVMTAHFGDPSRQPIPLGNDAKDEGLRKAHAFLVGCAQPDGGIYKKGLANYNTSISMIALLTERDARNDELLRRARGFVIRGQKHGLTGDPFDGGFSYDSPEGQADLSNAVYALEALHFSRGLQSSQELAKDPELDWKAAAGFLERCQNLPEYNKQPWASNDPQNKGGFVYSPKESKAGEVKLADGRVALRSYGSMTYAGLLSYIYADLKKDDPRVTAAHDWLRVNYTLEENPGMGKQGLYYYYEMMAKSLAAYGAKDLELADGRKVNWREDLAKKLINLQTKDGSWQNENGRWWEKDPVLTTAYSLIALEFVYREL